MGRWLIYWRLVVHLQTKTGHNAHLRNGQHTGLSSSLDEGVQRDGGVNFIPNASRRRDFACAEEERAHLSYCLLAFWWVFSIISRMGETIGPTFSTKHFITDGPGF